MLPNDTKKTLCQSLSQSHIDYAIPSWYAAMSQKAKTKLQIIQNKMIPFILDLGPRTHITTKHMADLKAMLLKNPSCRTVFFTFKRRRCVVVNFLWGYLHKNVFSHTEKKNARQSDPTKKIFPRAFSFPRVGQPYGTEVKVHYYTTWPLKSEKGNATTRIF